MSAAACTLAKSGTTIDLLAGDYALVKYLPIGAVPRDFGVLSGSGVDIATVTRTDKSAPRVVRLVVEVSGTDGQDCEDNLNDLIAVLPDTGETATLSVTRTDGDAAVTLTVLAASDLECDYDLARDAGPRATLTVDLACEPYAYGAAATLYSASAVTVPCVLSLADMTGLHAAPLSVLLDATTANLHHVAAGVYPDASATIAKFVLETVDLAWSAGAADTDANGYPDGTGNTVWKTNAAAGVYADVDVTDFEPGSYAVYVNARADADATVATLETTYTAAVDIESADLRRHLLGIVSLPCSAVRGSATSSLRVTMKGDDTYYAYANTVEFIPLSWGFAGWHHTTTTSYADKLRFEDGICYADDIASVAYMMGDGEIISRGGTLVVTGEGTAEAANVAVTATVTYTPRWEQFPDGTA